MDALDLDLLRALVREPRASSEALGGRIGLSGNAVKARLARLREEGALQGVVATPRAALLGLREGLLAFESVADAPEREDELLRGLPEVPGVRAADVGADAVHVHVLFRDEADWERIERAAISLVGKPPAHRAQLPAEDASPLAPQDARLLDALLADGRASIHDLAEATGLSRKTARRRLDALLARGDARLEAVVSPAEARGLSLARVALERAPHAPDPEGLLLLAPGPLAEGLVAGASPRAVHAALRAVRAAPGVVRALPIVGTRRHAEAWLRDALAARLVQAPSGRKDLASPAPRVRG